MKRRFACDQEGIGTAVTAVLPEGKSGMLNHRPVRIGILFGVLILALAAIGVGSALWSETLTIDGDVTTGNVDVEFDFVFTDDLGAEGECSHTGAPNELTVTMANVYPTYECHLQFDVRNDGSIPVLVDEPVWVMPPEITVTSNFCYGDDFPLPAPGWTGACNVTFTVGDVAQDSMYEFDGSVFAEQVTLP